MDRPVPPRRRCSQPPWGASPTRAEAPPGGASAGGMRQGPMAVAFARHLGAVRSRRDGAALAAASPRAPVRDFQADRLCTISRSARGLRTPGHPHVDSWGPRTHLCMLRGRVDTRDPGFLEVRLKTKRRLQNMSPAAKARTSTIICVIGAISAHLSTGSQPDPADKML